MLRVRRKVESRLAGGVGATDHDHVPPGVGRRRVGGRAAVNPSPHELLDPRSVQLAVGDARGDHAAAAPELRAAGEGEVDGLVRFGMGRLDLDADEELGADPARLLVCPGCELGAADAIGKARIVLDAGARAGLPAGHVPLAHERAKPL